MAHLLEKTVGNVIESATKKPPLGPGFEADLAAKADRLEVWGSLFAETGEDCCEYRLYKGEKRIASRCLKCR